MKKNLIFAVLTVFSLSACSDFLDEKLKGDYNSDIIYSNGEQAQLAVNGIYNAATYTTDLWKFGDVASDDAIKGGSDGDKAEINYIDDFSANSDNGMIIEFWQAAYESIARANNVIANVPGVDMNTTLRDRFVAEAKYFRALGYFNLVNIFGEVPLKLYPQISPENIHVPLSTVAKIYAQIEKDLTEAASALPGSYGGTDIGRVTQGAAYGLLAKAQLYQKNYSGALSSIQLLDASFKYDLVHDYANLFRLGSEDSVETVFAIRFLSDENPGLGNSLNQDFAPSDEGGYYLNAPTQSYVDVFTEKTITGSDDPRLDASIGRNGKPWLNDNVFIQSWSSTGYLVKKHNQPLSEVSTGRKGDGGLAYIYMRYADVLLMKAEAINETSGPGLAMTELNRVRHRAGLSDVVNASQPQLREIIRNERRRELGFEFHRFFDLMRWGKEVAEEALGSNFKWKEPRFYYPLPQAELDSNQGIK